MQEIWPGLTANNFSGDTFTAPQSCCILTVSSGSPAHNNAKAQAICLTKMTSYQQGNFHQPSFPSPSSPGEPKANAPNLIDVL